MSFLKPLSRITGILHLNIGTMSANYFIILEKNEWNLQSAQLQQER